MRAEFINPFLSSLLNVLDTMASTKLHPEKPRIKTDEIAMGDVSGVIGMVGPKTQGSMSITFDKSLAFTIMERMLGERPDAINADVTDMIGEITNMVTGGAKRQLAEKGFEFDMATPAIISGEDHTITHKTDGQIILMPFYSNEGRAYIEICFTE